MSLFVGILRYFSYLLLFLNFAYHSYIAGGKPEPKPTGSDKKRKSSRGKKVD